MKKVAIILAKLETKEQKKYQIWFNDFIEGSLEVHHFSVNKKDGQNEDTTFDVSGKRWNFKRIIRFFLKKPKAFYDFFTTHYRTRGILKTLKDWSHFAPLYIWEPDIIHFAEPGLFPIIKPRPMKAKTIVSFRGGDILVAPFVDPNWRKYLIEEMFPELTCVHFISYAMRDLAREFATNQDNFYVIPMGIETNLFNPSAEKSINQCVNLVTTARLSWQKGLPYALEVVKNLVDKGYDVKYHIIGDGPLRTELKYLTHILGLQDHIIFHGKVNLYEVQNILFDCDIYLQPSITENLCIATIEAMSMKLPIVASDVGALPELVTDNETGFLVPIINPEQFTESIEKLIHDPALRKKFGEKGREVVLDKYTIETERARWLEMYSRL